MKLPIVRFSSLCAAFALLAAVPLRVAATNGMNMEGYGPIATAMGGASMAYDNGTAAVINNPATLTLMPATDRLDVALGVLGPEITATAPNGVSARSKATAFFMPAFGYVRKSGNLVYGLGVFGQGGMGTEYDQDSWLGMGFGLTNRTEVSVGRAIIPLAYKVNDQLSIAATFDFIWAGMDLQMAMSGAQFMDLVSTHQIGQASGGIVQSFGGMMQTLPAGSSVDYAYFNFTNGSSFTGKARGYGYAGKIGLIYTPRPNLTFGLTYHTETELSDLKAPGNSISFSLNVPGMGHMAQKLAGDITVRDFEWPALLAAGVAWRPAERWLLVADLRQIFWARVMENFRLRFVASPATTNGGFAGQNLDAQLFQNWKDQTVVQLGGAYQVNPVLTLQAGFNFANNPVPDRFLNPLFPATVGEHLTGGFGWKTSEKTSVDFSLVYGFKATGTNGGGITVGHSQLNAQLMYSYRF
jgi:long-chain fatty acid transport protein